MTLMIWAKAVGFAVIELISSVIIIFVYLIFAWLIFGEGGNSLFYIQGTKIVGLLIPILIMSIINMKIINKGLKVNRAERVLIFKLAEIILIVLYISFSIWQWNIK